jgi:hypothetical protein
MDLDNEAEELWKKELELKLARMQQEEEARKQKAEEDARKKIAEKEEAKKKKEQEEAKHKIAQEEAKKREEEYLKRYWDEYYENQNRIKQEEENKRIVEESEKKFLIQSRAAKALEESNNVEIEIQKALLEDKAEKTILQETKMKPGLNRDLAQKMSRANKKMLKKREGKHSDGKSTVVNIIDREEDYEDANFGLRKRKNQLNNMKILKGFITKEVEPENHDHLSPTSCASDGPWDLIPLDIEGQEILWTRDLVEDKHQPDLKTDTATFSQIVSNIVTASSTYGDLIPNFVFADKWKKARVEDYTETMNIEKDT